MSADGYVVSNYHVVGGATDIRVVLSDGREISGDIILSDEDSDLAVLKINSDEMLPHLDLRKSDTVEVGELVLAIGNPFGFGGTVTAGIVSARGRNIGGSYDDYIQTDASINRGNSGGPLFDMKGNVVSWSSAGRCNFKGSRKSTAFAATTVAQDAARSAIGHGMTEVEVRVQGPGAGRESAVRAIQSAGLIITSIKDTTAIPHNGCRPPKRRRV